MPRFEIRTRDGLARIGKLVTDHGTVQTPLLMPVVHPGKSAISPTEMREHFGFQMVITNSYIIKSHDRFREPALEKGVHHLLGFDGAIMTDSGTFQMYFHELSHDEIDPIEIIEFQKGIGSDIGTILDAFSDPDVGRAQVENDVRVSLERAEASAPRKEEMMLAGTVQGGVFPDLREHSAKALATMDFDVHPIGGVVPLMERYRYADIVRITLAAKQHLPANRPVHLFGCGHPMFFAQAALLGCDFFDSASYAKFAEAGRMLLQNGTAHLDQLSEMPCACPVCSRHQPDDLLALPKEQRDLELMRHNLYVTSAEMRTVRQAIQDNKLFELVAQRARNHPSLLEALEATIEFHQIIERSDLVGKTSSVFYTGQETLFRPEIVRFNTRVIQRYPNRKTRSLVIVPDDGRRPFADTAGTIIKAVRETESSDVLLAFLTPLGVIPWELEHIHPVQQCLFPDRLHDAILSSATGKLRDFLDLVDFERLLWFDRPSSVSDIIQSMESEITVKCQTASDLIEHLEISSPRNKQWIRRKLQSVLAFQWGQEASKLSRPEELEADISRTTGKIRHVRQGGSLLFTMVPTTGLLTPTYEGGLRLQDAKIDTTYVVKIDDEVREFVAGGKSALAKFVREAGNDLRAGEEVLVTDEGAELLGVGRALLSGPEMIVFDRGVAVNIRHSKKA